MGGRISPHTTLIKPKKLSEKEAKEVRLKFNISIAQLPMIKLADAALPPGSKVGDMIKGAKLLRVTSDGAELELNGRPIMLSTRRR